MHPDGMDDIPVSGLRSRPQSSAEDLARQEYSQAGFHSIEDLDSISIIAIYWGHHDDVQRTCRPVKEIKNEHP
jgi:hypothetical protein